MITTSETLLPIKGHVTVHLVPRGQNPLKPRARDLVWESDNLFTRIGYQRIAAYLAAYTGNTTSPRYVVAGKGTAAPAVTDTKMGMELGRVSLSSYSVLSSYTARLVGIFGVTQAIGTWTEIGLGDTSGYPTSAIPGTATGYTTTTLTDSGAAWTTNQWVGYTVYIVNATTGSMQSSVITSNTATVLTFGAITLPTGTVSYTIGGPYLFAHATVSVVKTASVSANVSWSLTQQYV